MYMRGSLTVCLALSILLFPGCKRDDKNPAPPTTPAAKAPPTQPAAGQADHPPTGGAVLSLRILADKIDDDATEFASLRLAITKEGTMSIPNWPGYRWFVIRNPAAFFRDSKIEENFPGVSRETSMVVERVNGKCYVLAHTEKDYAMTHEPGAEPWTVGQAWTDQEAAGDFSVVVTLDQEAAGDFSVVVTLDERGAKQLTALTQPRQGKVLGIMINDEVIVPATIGGPLGEMMKIAGSFAQPEAEALVSQLRQGASPVNPPQ
jgi:hypothetical protein